MICHLYPLPVLMRDILEKHSNACCWCWASLKQYFAQLFDNFYKPAPTKENGGSLGGEQVDLFKQLRARINAQIRALTGDDITKEATIMKMDTWRALTELDAKAKEAEEIRKAAQKP